MGEDDQRVREMVTSPHTRASEGYRAPTWRPPNHAPSPPGNPPRPSPEPEEPRRPAPAERSGGSGTPKLIQRALLRGTALLASLGLGRDLQPRGEPQPAPPTLPPTQPPSSLPSRLLRASPKTPEAPASRLSPEAPGPPTPAPLLLELGVPAGQPSAKSPRREEGRRGEWPGEAPAW